MSKYTEGPWSVNGCRVECESGAMIAGVFDGHLDAKDHSKETEIANANLIAAAPDLLKALKWALPLARLAMEAHRMERLRCGHNDIVGKYKSGQTWSGIYKSEIDDIEFADAAIAKAKGLQS